MQISINIPDELAIEAQSHGLTPQAYAELLLKNHSSAKPVRPFRSAEEIQSWLGSLSQFSDKIPSLPETISREWLYQDHD
jgi:hypothetical protein